MGRPVNFIEFVPPLPTGEVPYDGSINFNDEKRLVEPYTIEEHPLLVTIRNNVTKYRMQSAAHFDLTIDVKQAFRLQDMDLTHQTRINVIFAEFSGQDVFICRPVFRKHPRKDVQVFAKKVEVWESGRFVPLIKFLRTRFPCFPEAVGIREMQAWWGANGKVFNWLGLPTELKEHVISFCVHPPPKQSDAHRRKVGRHRSRFASNHGPNFGVYEIVNKLTVWAALLGVSHQVRAITLRLCFAGSSDMTQGNGFSIEVSSTHGLGKTLRRLGRYYSMTEPYSLPVNDESQALADCYKQYPKIFPHLRQYATFRHGIRRIYMDMNFFNYMQFFRVTVGGYERYQELDSVSYEVLDQLPHLTDIAIKLPGRPPGGWTNIRRPGPWLFHDDSPCPRTLHRIIYERALEVLTIYPRIKMHNFVDEDEETRFNELREAAMENAKWTAADYKELYEECGGGVQLEESVQPGSWAVGTDEEDMAPVVTNEQTTPLIVEETVDDFFPPKCRCLEKCHLLFS